MMKVKEFEKPEIVVSRCLGFGAVRYDGSMIRSDEVEALKKYVNFTPVCPEVEIGLGIPRAVIRIVRIKNEDRLIQPSTGMDVTERMNEFSDSFLSELNSTDGFIMKNRSPSSGISDVNVYPGPDKSNKIDRRPGFFGGAVIDRFPDYPVEDEGRLKNERIRDNFLTRIFLLADFRITEAEEDAKELTEFHHKNKTLLLSYSQKYLKILGKIAADQNSPHEEIFRNYRINLLLATKRPINYKSEINAFMHAFGQISDKINNKEKEYFLESLESYRKNLLPGVAVKKILLGWAVSDDKSDLKDQTFFRPYPDELNFYHPESMQRGKEFIKD
jgi:uncharacterized protein YbbK (DUF523 family)/uncharacterized protein YbgA (DUF1722 family)